MAKKKRSRRSKYLIPAIAIAGAGILGAIALKSVSGVGQSYNCVSGSCVAVPGTGGQYATLAACQAACGGGGGPTATTDKTQYNLDAGDIIHWTTSGWPVGANLQPTVQGRLADSQGNVVGSGDIIQVDSTGAGAGILTPVGLSPGSYNFFVGRLPAGEKTALVPIMLVSILPPPGGGPPVYSGPSAVGSIAGQSITVTLDKATYSIAVDDKIQFEAKGFTKKTNIQAEVLDANKKIAGMISGADFIKAGQPWVADYIPIDLNNLPVGGLPVAYVRLFAFITAGGACTSSADCDAGQTCVNGICTGGTVGPTGAFIDVGPIAIIPQPGGLNPTLVASPLTLPISGGLITLSGDNLTPKAAPILFMSTDTIPGSLGQHWAGGAGLTGQTMDSAGHWSADFLNQTNMDDNWHFMLEDRITGLRSNEVVVVQGAGSTSNCSILNGIDVKTGPPTATVDSPVYDVGGTISWVATNFSQGVDVQAILYSSDMKQIVGAGSPQRADTIGLACGALQLTVAAGNYLLRVEENQYSGSQKSKAIPITVVTPTGGVNPPFWLSDTPGGPPITEISQSGQITLYLGGSGWPGGKNPFPPGIGLSISYELTNVSGIPNPVTRLGGGAVQPDGSLVGNVTLPIGSGSGSWWPLGQTLTLVATEHGANYVYLGVQSDPYQLKLIGPTPAPPPPQNPGPNAPPVVGTAYNCVNGICVADPNGQYANLAACQAACGGAPTGVTLTVTPTQLPVAVNGQITLSGVGYTYSEPSGPLSPIVAHIWQDGNDLENYAATSFQLPDPHKADSTGHLSGIWTIGTSKDSTWHFQFWDTGKNLYSNQVDVIVGAGTPIRPPSPPPPQLGAFIVASGLIKDYTFPPNTPPVGGQSFAYWNHYKGQLTGTGFRTAAEVVALLGLPPTSNDGYGITQEYVVFSVPGHLDWFAAYQAGFNKDGSINVAMQFVVPPNMKPGETVQFYIQQLGSSSINNFYPGVVVATSNMLTLTFPF